ncbi:major facilitator superfamily domain-containing protein [Xylariales sp. PMI_506]|nr:major facilitator superfamily domain-containing protein [Xylariales sp. PMI_506]
MLVNGARSKKITITPTLRSVIQTHRSDITKHLCNIIRRIAPSHSFRKAALLWFLAFQAVSSMDELNMERWEADSANPKNWPLLRRQLITLTISLFMLVSPVSSSIVAPALPILKSQFQISSDFVSQIILSIFILASAVGPLVVSPLSEVYGRRLVLHFTMLIFLIFNVACALAKTAPQLLIFRFLAGVGGSAPAIGPGILGDCWRPEERGGFIIQYLNWRWVFYSTSIFSALVQGVGAFLVPETYPPIIQARISAERGCHAEAETSDRGNPFQVLLHALMRPIKLIGTQIIIQVLAIYTSFVYGLLYLALSTFVNVFTDVYGETPNMASLHYLSLAIGFTFGTQMMALICDRIYAILKARNNGIGIPEHRAPLLLPGALFVPVGLFLYGWSVQYRFHWIFPDLGAGLLGCGIIIGMQAVTTYIVDAYPLSAASATAALTVPRAICGFSFPMFAPYLYRSLHYGWGNSLLGFLAVIIGWPAPFILWKYGAALRARSRYATNLK